MRLILSTVGIKLPNQMALFCFFCRISSTQLPSREQHVMDKSNHGKTLHSAANTAIIYVIALHSGSRELCFVSQRTVLIQLLTSYQVTSIKAVMRFIKQMVCISTCTGGVVLGMTQVRVDDVSSDSHLSSESLLRQRYLRNNYYRMHCAYWK